MNNLIYYISGLLLVQTLLLLWFYSPLRITIGQLLFDKDLYTFDQFETYLLVRSSILGKLLSCYICSSFWLSLNIGIGFVLFANTPWYWPFFTALSYPSICYLYKKIID